MKIKIFIIALLLLSEGKCYSSDFTKIITKEFWNSSSTTPCWGNIFTQLGGFMHFPRFNEPYVVVNQLGDKKQYTKFTSGLDVDILHSNPMGFIPLSSANPYQVQTYAYVHEKGFLTFTSEDQEPIFKNYYNKDTLMGFVGSGGGGGLVYSSLTGLTTGFDNNYDNLFYYYTRYVALYKENFDLTNSISFKKYDFPTVGSKKMMITDPILYNSVLYTPNTIWVAFNASNCFAGFNIANEEWTVYDSTNLPIELGRGGIDDGLETTGNWQITSFFLDDYLQDRKPIITGFESRIINGHRKTNSFILYFDHSANEWDTILVNPLESEYWIENYSRIYKAFPIYDKIVLSFIIHPTEASLSEPASTDDRTVKQLAFMIYDLKTRTYQYVAPQSDQFSVVENSWYTVRVAHINSYKDMNDKSYIGILYTTGDLFKYDAHTGIEDLEEGIFQDIGFRYVYPNPTAPSKHVIANIMCYVPDISKLEFGLYNFMGQKILDLNNQFEYSESTHTVNLNFGIPKELSSGVYFLNVRNEDETHTKTVIVVGE